MEYRKTVKDWVDSMRKPINEIGGVDVEFGEALNDNEYAPEDLVLYEDLIRNLKRLYEKVSSLVDESDLEDSDEILTARKHIKAAISNLIAAQLRAKNRK